MGRFALCVLQTLRVVLQLGNRKAANRTGTVETEPESPKPNRLRFTKKLEKPETRETEIAVFNQAAVAVVATKPPLSRSNRGRSLRRGRSHQAAITKLSRNNRGRSRCRGRSHQAAITKLAAATVVVAVAVVVATKPQSPSCRGRIHQAAITKLSRNNLTKNQSKLNLTIV